MSRQEFTGDAGTAFRVELAPPDDRLTHDAVACIGRWNLTLPGQHAFWNRYSLNICHLRDFPSMTPAVKESPDKTHEILVFAVAPDYPEDKFQKGGIAILEPLNHVVQFVSSSDANAVEVAEAMVQRLVNGMELAEPQGIMGARDRFRDSVYEAAGEL